MFDYNEDAKRAVEKLDEYDFTITLGECFESYIRDPYDIRNCISERYPKVNDALSDLTEDEWMEYLSARYPVRFEEIVRYRMWYKR